MNMAKRAVNNVKLGVFVLAGLIFLILLLYMIGRNRNLFGSNFTLKARFENVQGLNAGNNVRYAGIDAGTVKKIKIINDTTMEVVMIIDDRMKPIIHKNAIVSIATDGLVGNRVVNMTASKQPSALVEDGDILPSKKPLDTDEMLRTLSKTNKDIAYITENLKTTVERINNSTALWSLLNDKSLPLHIKQSALSIRQATSKANEMANDLYSILNDVKKGKGSLGNILRDTTIAYNLNEAILKIQTVSDDADVLTKQVNTLLAGIQTDINSGKGVANALLKDSTLTLKLNESLENIQKGTDGFNQNMEALKHNFLFRGYFKKLEKQKKKENK